jgi:hypothetical protein
MYAQIKQSRVYQTLVKLPAFFPVLFFFGGFAWDALTIGRHVAAFDLVILSAYLAAAAGILYYLGQPNKISSSGYLASLYQRFRAAKWQKKWPYFMLQFLFGSMLSPLFILYFQSASHAWAWIMILLLGGLLVGNEYMENKYRQFTISWALFGFCAMLLLNFALPFLLGSIHAAWFYLSTLLGAGLAYGLYRKTPVHNGNIKPVWLIALLLMLAYRFDVIPPVPLVKRDLAVAYELRKVGGVYQLSQQPSGWWVFWRPSSNHLKTTPGQRVYFFSSVFAPGGLNTRLYHRWQHFDEKRGWQTQSRIGYSLAGGRENGFRGYTYKQGLQAGDWRASVETENNKTVAVETFSVEMVHSKATPVVTAY